jgi:hypothetical protein
MKIHPLLENMLATLVHLTGNRALGDEYSEWCVAGKPVVEEEPTTEVGRVLSRHGCYKDQELDIKDARIRKLEQEGHNAHALYREADAMVKELQAKLSEATSEGKRYAAQLAEAEKHPEHPGRPCVYCYNAALESAALEVERHGWHYEGQGSVRVGDTPEENARRIRALKKP